MNNMAVSSLKSNLTNPQRTYTWNMIIPNPIGGGDTETLMLRCQSTSIPARTIGAIPVPYKQSGGVNFHGKLGYTHSWSCTMIEGEDRRIFDSMYAWHQNIVHDIDNVGIGDISIKSDIIIQMLSTKGEETMRIKLVGCFPTSLGEVSLSYGDEQVVNYACTFSFDSWERI